MSILQGHYFDGYYSDYNFSDIMPVIYIYIYIINILTYIDNRHFSEDRFLLVL